MGALRGSVLPRRKEAHSVRGSGTIRDEKDREKALALATVASLVSFLRIVSAGQAEVRSSHTAVGQRVVESEGVGWAQRKQRFPAPRPQGVEPLCDSAMAFNP